MRGLPKQWSHLHTGSAIQAAHPLEASCNCVNTITHQQQWACVHCRILVKAASSNTGGEHWMSLDGVHEALTWSEGCCSAQLLQAE